MGELKSAYELAMEKLKAKDGDDLVELSPAQKEAIAEARKEHRARLAEREIMLADSLRKLESRTPPEERPGKRRALEEEHAQEKSRLESELEARIAAIRSG